LYALDFTGVCLEPAVICIVFWVGGGGVVLVGLLFFWVWGVAKDQATGCFLETYDGAASQALSSALEHDCPTVATPCSDPVDFGHILAYGSAPAGCY